MGAAGFFSAIPEATAQDSNRVWQAQRCLTALGHYEGPIDGITGTGTQSAILDFQQAMNIAPTAALDSLTWVTLQAAHDLNPRPDVQATNGPAVTTSDSDRTPAFAEVFEIQMLLDQLGYGDLVPDGQIGPNTSAALADFQRDEGLPDDGSLSPETLARLRQSAPVSNACHALATQEIEYWLALLGYEMRADGAGIEAFNADESLAATGALTPETYDVLRQRVGDLTEIPREDRFVVEAQLRLAAAGYDVGPIDGIQGQQFQEALGAFQQVSGLPATDRLDQATLATLRGYGEDAETVGMPQSTLDAAFELRDDVQSGALVGSVGTTGAAASADVTYSLDESADGRFMIDPLSGNITVADAALIDYDRDQSHRLVAAATDDAGVTRTGVVSIIIVDTEFQEAADTYEQAILTLDPVAYWRLDALADGVVDSGGGYGDTAVDRVGRHPGTYNGGTDTDDEGPFAAIRTGTTHFDGDDEFVHVPGAGEFLPAEGTILIWFAADQTEGDSSLIHIGDGSTGLDVSINDARLRFSIATATIETAADSVETERWHQIAASWNADELWLHLDGRAVGSRISMASGPPRTGDLVIAADNDGGRTFAGRISEVALLDTPSSPDRINHLIDRGINGKDVMIGTPAADTLIGTVAAVIYGKAGNDVITGASGDDVIYGGPGDDSIDGGGGDDQLFGGDGRDVFSLASTGGTSTAYGGTDGSDDRISLVDIEQGPDVGNWSYELTHGAITEEGAGYIRFDRDTDGFIVLPDGTRMEFKEIERIEW